MNKLLLLTCLLSSMLGAQTLDIWAIKDGVDNDININPLEFANRASCGLDANKATKSAFILIDNVNPAKALHRLASDTGMNNSEVVKLGVEKFRYTSFKLLEIISKKLLSGSIPLLNSKEFLSLSKECKNTNDCRELYDYISKSWSSEIEGEYLPKEIVTGSNNFSCHYLKKFSPVQAHLFGIKPGIKTMNTIAEAGAKHSEYLVDCNNIENQNNLKVANYQLDLRNIDDELWSKYGFEYWTSLKLYFSWAFRYSSEQESLSSPFEQVFSSVAIEENVVFVPNGCKSIVAPKCDEKTLSLNTMRAFAQSGSAQSIFDHDMMEQIPEGPEQDLIQTPITDVNTDILQLGNYESADKWALNFRENFTKARGFIKLKLTNSVNKLKAIKSFNILDKMESDLDKVHELIQTNKLDSEHAKLIKDELYYTCSEFVIAASDKLSFIKDDFKILKDVRSLNKAVSKLSKFTVTDYYSYFESLSKSVISKCDKLQAKGFWGDGHEINKEGHHSWYKEIYYEKSFPHKTKTITDIVKYEEPLLTYNSYDQDNRKSSIICTNSSNCARLYLDAILDLYAVVQYSNSLLPLTDEFKSPQLFNPISERVSCKVYDPWRKTRTSIFSFFSDVASGALFGLLPTPVYLTGQFDPKKPTSFNRLVQDGNIVFDPKFNKKRVKGALNIDFGNLIGLPCQVSISGSDFNPGRYYAFTGISLNSCVDRRRSNLTVTGANDMSSTQRDRSACAGCALNFESVARAASFVNPIFRTGYFLVRGVYNLFRNLRDPNDIPKSYSVDLNKAAHAYRKYGLVSKSCRRKLLRGKDCLRNKCEDTLVSAISRFTDETITASDVKSLKKYAYFRLSNCNELISIKLWRNKSRLCNDSDSLSSNDINIPSSCSHLFKGKR